MAEGGATGVGELEGVLENLRALSEEVTTAAVLSRDGELRGSTLPPGVDRERHAAMLAALAGIARRISRENGASGFTQARIGAEGGYVLLVGLEGGGTIAATTGPDARVGLVLYDMRNVRAEIERMFVDLDYDDPVLGRLAGRSLDVRERLQALSHIGAGGRLIRTHGDYHLGQTMLTDRGWVILDFEGEPARSLPERRRKRSPLRDVAGMLRSFAYAASAAEQQSGVVAPEGWEERARAAFLEGYFEAVDSSLLPHGQAAIGKLLSVFELEKAVYELRYELNNRPDWVAIPVAGIERLLDADE